MKETDIKFEISLAARNLFRSKRRTFFTLTACIIGMVGLTLLDGYITFSMWGLKETIIRSGVGHFQVAKSDEYFSLGENDPSNHYWTEYERDYKLIARIPSVKYVIPTLSFWGLINRDKRNQSVLIKAFPKNDEFNFWTFRRIFAGRDFFESDSDGILVGKGLAERMNISVDDFVDTYGSSSYGSINILSMRVIGIFETGIRAFDQNTCFVGLDSAQDLIQQSAITNFTVITSSESDTNEVMNKVSEEFKNQRNWQPAIKSWQDLSPYYQEANGSYSTVLLVARIIIILIAFFAITNTLSMSVVERFRELGTICSFGGNFLGLIRVLSWEGLFLGIAGALSGLLFGYFTSFGINMFGGINMPAQPGMSNSLQVYFTPDISNGVTNSLFVILFSVAGTFIAAIKIRKKTIAELLRS